MLKSRREIQALERRLIETNEAHTAQLQQFQATTAEQLQQFESDAASQLQTMSAVYSRRYAAIQNAEVGICTSYDSMVEAVGKAYNGYATYGSHIMYNLINTRAAFTVGEGVVFRAREGMNADRELAYMERLLVNNGLDYAGPHELACEAEITGKCAVGLWMKNGQVEVRFLPYEVLGYEVEIDGVDYLTYTGMSFNKKDSSGKKMPSLKPEQFVYGRFGGRYFYVNNTPPRLGKVLRYIQNLDRVIRDWRDINSVSAHPTPTITPNEGIGATAIKDDLKDSDGKLLWEPGDMVIVDGKFAWETPPTSAGIDSLRQEMEALVKSISANSGIPPHFLGHPDLMSNRSVADNLIDMILMTTSKETQTWEGWWQELVFKSITMQNERGAPGTGGMKTDVIEVSIQQIAAAKISELQETWLPLHMSGALSLDSLLSKIPGIDATEERLRIENDQLRLLPGGALDGTLDTASAM